MISRRTPPAHLTLVFFSKCYSVQHVQHTFITFVGGKLLGQTFLGSPTVRTVGVGVTLSLLLWKFCWKWLKSQTNTPANTNSFQLLGVQNFCVTTLFPDKREKGFLILFLGSPNAHNFMDFQSMNIIRLITPCCISISFSFGRSIDKALRSRWNILMNISDLMTLTLTLWRWNTNMTKIFFHLVQKFIVNLKLIVTVWPIQILVNLEINHVTHSNKCESCNFFKIGLLICGA